MIKLKNQVRMMCFHLAILDKEVNMDRCFCSLRVLVMSLGEKDDELFEQIYWVLRGKNLSSMHQISSL
jgi:hypothetical protein